MKDLFMAIGWALLMLTLFILVLMVVNDVNPTMVDLTKEDVFIDAKITYSTNHKGLIVETADTLFLAPCSQFVLLAEINDI